MAKKKLPDLEQLTDEQVVALLRDRASLAFSLAECFRLRIDRMTGSVYAEAAQLLSRLRDHADDRSTGRSF